MNRQSAISYLCETRLVVSSLLQLYVFDEIVIHSLILGVFDKLSENFTLYNIADHLLFDSHSAVA